MTTHPTRRTAGQPRVGPLSAANVGERFVLLFFGYTYCPDVCPLTMASARAAVSRLPEADRDRVLPLFVTVDPGRDSIPRLREWLGTMDPDAVGLRGSTTELDGLMTAMGFVLPPSTSRRSIEGATDEDLARRLPLRTRSPLKREP